MSSFFHLMRDRTDTLTADLILVKIDALEELEIEIEVLEEIAVDIEES